MFVSWDAVVFHAGPSHHNANLPAVIFGCITSQMHCTHYKTNTFVWKRWVKQPKKKANKNNQPKTLNGGRNNHGNAIKAEKTSRPSNGRQSEGLPSRHALDAGAAVRTPRSLGRRDATRGTRHAHNGLVGLRGEHAAEGPRGARPAQPLPRRLVPGRRASRCGRHTPRSAPPSETPNLPRPSIQYAKNVFKPLRLQVVSHLGQRTPSSKNRLWESGPQAG